MPDDDKKTETKKASVDETLGKVGDLLVKAGAGYDKAMGTGAGVPEGGLKVGERVGGAPPQLAVPFSPSTTPSAPPTPNVPPPPMSPPRTGPGVIPSEYGNKSAKQGAVVGSAIDNIAQAIHTFKSKRDADALSKAQNSYQLFQTALQQGDQHTANLLATDPKIVKGWEKYLKMEFPRETGTPTPEQKPTGTVPPDRSLMDRMMGRNKEPMARLPEINTPGGIAIPRPGPEQQMHTAMVNQMIEGLKNNDPRAVAAVYGENYKLSAQEFRDHSRAEFGFELTPVQASMIEEHNKSLMLKSKSDFMKFIVGQSLSSQSRVEVANIQGGWRLLGDKERASAIRDAATIRANSAKDIQGAKGDQINKVIMKSNLDMYSRLAATYAAKGADLIKSDHKKEGDSFLKESEAYAQKSEEIRSRMEAEDMLNKLGINMEGLDDETPDDEPEEP